MPANPINQLASVGGLAFPPGMVYPDPALGTLTTPEELEQSAYSFALDVTVAVATTIASNAGDNQSATVGTTLPINPSVLVTDAGGNPFAGQAVTFAVASWGGSITGAVQTTNAAGIATVGSWILGASIGANTLTATSVGLAGSPVTFNATGVAAAVVVPRPDSYIWQIPKGSKRTYATAASVLPLPASHGRLRQTGRESVGVGVSVLPIPVSVGTATAQSAPEVVWLAGYSELPAPVSFGLGRAESEDDEIVALFMAYVAGRR